jgi:hypothetical protein
VDKREQLLKRLDKAWCEFKESYAGLSDQERLEPGVTGAWSVKDIIAHVTSWEEELLKALPLILAGKRPPLYSVTHGGIDAFNAQATAKRSHLPLIAVLQQQDDVHQRVVEFVESAPEDQLGGDTRFRRRLRVDTYSHYPKHAEAIRRWRERKSTVV